MTPQFYFRNLFSRHLFLFTQDFILFSVVYFLFSGDLFLFVQHFCFLDFSYLGKTKINVVISNLCCSLKLKLFASLWVQDNGLLSRDNKTLSCENKKNVVQYKKFWNNEIFFLFYRDTKKVAKTKILLKQKKNLRKTKICHAFVILRFFDFTRYENWANKNKI